MLRIFKNRYPNAKVTFSGGNEVLVEMKFDDAAPREPNSQNGQQPAPPPR
jgi:hypothetical protein